jgi:hypothetical protein
MVGAYRDLQPVRPFNFLPATLFLFGPKKIGRTHVFAKIKSWATAIDSWSAYRTCAFRQIPFVPRALLSGVGVGISRPKTRLEMTIELRKNLA